MANHISAVKRMRQTRRRTARNRRNKGVLRAGMREIREVLAASNLDQVRQQMPAAFSRLDKATPSRIELTAATQHGGSWGDLDRAS